MSRKHRDTRVPVEVTHIGKYTVRIYDMAAYEESIRRYSVPTERQGKGHNARTGAPARNRYHIRPRQKPLARFNWISPGARVPPAQEQGA